MSRSWYPTRLGDVCEFVRGPFGGSLKKSCFVNDGVAVYEQQHAINDQFDFVRYFIDDEKFAEMARFELKVGDLIMSCSGTIGRVAIVPKGIRKGIINQALLKLTPRSALDAKFLKAWMDSEAFAEQITKHSKGVAIKNAASVKVLKEIVINLPSLKEQRRIVSVLDEAFAAIAKAKENAERNLANAKELFDSYLERVFTYVQDSRRCRLADLVTRLTNGYVGPTRNIYQDDGIPYLLAKHVRDNVLTFDEKTYVSQEFNQKNSKSTLKAGDVLLVQSGHIGHSAVVTRQHAGHNCHAMIVITPKSNVLVGDYLSLYFNSPEMKSTFQLIRSGSTVPHLTCKAVKEISIPVTAKEVQQQVVAEAMSIRQSLDRLIATRQISSAALDELKQSILRKAFTGELTANSPELEAIP